MKYILLLVFPTLCSSFSAVAQYKGGSNDGSDWLQLKGIQHPFPEIYNGGVNDGHSTVALAGQNPGPEIYAGGADDGVAASQAKGFQNRMPGIYAGGADDGVSSVSTRTLHALPNIYTGGNEDGVAAAAVLAMNGTPSIYLGGANDGVNMAGEGRGLENMLPPIYAGGGNNPDDGYDFTVSLHQNENNPGPPPARDALRTVPLVQLSGTWFNDDAVLGWQAAAGAGFDHFELERSEDGGAHFASIATIEPYTAATQWDYRYTDVRAYYIPGDYLLYRLRSVDQKGGAGYSAVVKLSKDKTAPVIVAYPNPTSGRFTLALLNVADTKGYTYVLSNVDGKLMKRGSIEEANTSFDLGGYSSATYHLFLFKDGKSVQHFTILLTQ
jgi:hypothetical protein